LLAAGALYLSGHLVQPSPLPPLSSASSVSSVSWATLGTAGAALAAAALVDLVARALTGGWHATAGAVPGIAAGAGARTLGVLAAPAALCALCATLLPGFLRVSRAARPSDFEASHGDVMPLPGEGERSRALARLVRSAADAATLVIVREGFPDSAAFRYVLDLPIERTLSLEALAARTGRGREALVVFREPLPRADHEAMRALLGAHPALRIESGRGSGRDGANEGALWAIDLRSWAPGIRSYICQVEPRAPTALERHLLHPDGERRCHWRRDPWRELDLDVAWDAGPSREHAPAVSLPAATDRVRLLAYHNMRVRLGEGASARRAREVLLAGTAAPPAWIDPASFGWVAGARWSAGTRELIVTWECAGALAPVAAAPDFGLRIVLFPLGRAWRPEHLDFPGSHVCDRADAGELGEDAYPVRFPYRGRFAPALEITRPRGSIRRATGHALALPIALEHTR
jgi:hypothetical protein